MARALEERNQKATPRVARIVGITIASMIPSELNRICRSAEAMGPFGSSTPSEQPPSATAPIKAITSTAYRISNLVCPEPDKTAHGEWCSPSAPEIRLGEI